MNQTAENILNYQNPQSDYARMKLPAGKWILAGFASFILACFFINQNVPVIAIGLLILVLLCNVVAFVRSAITNREFLPAIFAFMLTGIYFVILAEPFAYRSHPHQPQAVKAKVDIKSMEDAVEAFKVDTGRYPTTDEGLAILVDNTSNIETWKGPYINYQPDPWANDYLYQFPGKLNPNGFDILSAGPDGVFNTADDLINW